MVNVDRKREAHVAHRLRKAMAHPFAREGLLGSNRMKQVGSWLFRLSIIIGISFVILSPIISLISRSLMPLEEYYSPLVYVVPMHVTLEHFQMAIQHLGYWDSLVETLVTCVVLTLLQLMVCSLVGYGFARYRLPMGGLMFGLVVLTIVIPSQALLIPTYMQFLYFDPLGLCTLFTGHSISLINTPWPQLLMTALGMGLNAGLYIYIFRQFFRGMPAALEEAAWIDGAGPFKTFIRIMLPNATPAMIIVTLFSVVWQYNDTFFAGLFSTSDSMLACRLSSLQSVLVNIANIRDVNLLDSIIKTGVLLVILPLVILYIFLQRFFMEGIERSGIVG